MKEQLNVVSSSAYGMALKQLEAHIEYEKTKLERFEFRLSDIQKSYKECFNDSTKDIIVSHGEKFISVQNNPFA